MKKADRQNSILDIVARMDVETQQGLVESLRGLGIEATQSTVSRDIKELRLGKKVVGDGRRVYAVHGAPDAGHTAQGRAAVFAEGYLRADYSQNIVVVKTRSGMANACAVAIDALRIPDVVGTLAGDDTIMVVTRDAQASSALALRLAELADAPRAQVPPC